MDRPMTASGRVRITSSSSATKENPVPRASDGLDDDGDFSIADYLSPASLREISGEDDLSQVKAIELVVDTTQTSMGLFGNHLPALESLKLTGSVISSVRDLGTSLSNLRVLWLSRCGLDDLDGISSLCSLRELYLAFNNISECRPLTMLDTLEVLDLESNALADPGQVEFLNLLPNLEALTLEGNPLALAAASIDEYRSRVFDILPRLKRLDDLPRTARLSGPSALPAYQHDEDLVAEGLKYRMEYDEETGTTGRPGTAQIGRRPGTARPRTGRVPTARPGTAQVGARPRTAAHGRLGSGADAVDGPDLDDGSSNLTHGSDVVFCGNPLKALMARRRPASGSDRENAGSAADADADADAVDDDYQTPSPVQPLEDIDLNALLQSVGLLDKQDTAAADEDEFDDTRSREDVFAELREWRRKFSSVTTTVEEASAEAIMGDAGSAASSATAEVLVLDHEPAPAAAPTPRPPSDSLPPSSTSSRSRPPPPGAARPATAGPRARRVRPRPPSEQPFDGAATMPVRPRRAMPQPPSARSKSATTAQSRARKLPLHPAGTARPYSGPARSSEGAAAAAAYPTSPASGSPHCSAQWLPARRECRETAEMYVLCRDGHEQPWASPRQPPYHPCPAR